MDLQVGQTSVHVTADLAKLNDAAVHTSAVCAYSIFEDKDCITSDA